MEHQIKNKECAWITKEAWFYYVEIMMVKIILSCLQPYFIKISIIIIISVTIHFVNFPFYFQAQAQ